MRSCGACGGRLRADESLSSVWLHTGCGGAGMYSACPRCVANALGQPEPRARTYPQAEVGSPRGLPFGVCGVCRRALHDGERPRSIRLEASDDAGVGPGAYHCCSECWDRLAPVVTARWVREGVVPEGARPGRLL